MGLNPRVIIYLLFIAVTLTLNLMLSNWSWAKSNEPEMEIIVIKSESLLERHELYTFTTEASVKKLLISQDIIPTTTEWMEVSLLCERLYTHLKNKKYKCTYEYYKIIDAFNKAKDHCRKIFSDDYVMKEDEYIEFSNYGDCMKSYGFKDPSNWKSYRNPLKIESKETEENQNDNAGKTEL